MSEVAGQGWEVEFLPRHSKEILVISHDGEARGSIEVYTDEEKERWVRAIESLDQPLSQKHTSQTLIQGSPLPVKEPTTSGDISNRVNPTSPTGT
jgi:hypothetical protein